jgi:hypothetical protein
MTRDNISVVQRPLGDDQAKCCKTATRMGRTQGTEQGARGAGGEISFVG